MMFDLVLTGGRVVDPEQNLDATLDVCFANGKIAYVGKSTEHQAKTVRDVSGLVVTPGLIDLHTHVYWGGTSMGVDASSIALRSGTTTLVDAGSAGPGNFLGFRHHIIEKSPVRILPYLNICFAGIFAYSRAVMVGECSDLRLINPSECVRVIRENRDLIVGVKARVGSVAGGNSGIAPLELALEVANEVGLPVMAHIDNPPPSRKDILSLLRPGDVLTHCCKPFPNSPVRADGSVWEDVLLARERGVYFDVAHGGASFGFAVARNLLKQGFKPDVISSDVHMLNVDGPVFDLMVTLSKFFCLGMDLTSVIRAATSAPAAALRRADLGSLKEGFQGDATIFEISSGEFEYKDSLGEVLRGKQRFRPRAIVKAGTWIDSMNSLNDLERTRTN